MARYNWDKASGKWVKISDRSYAKPSVESRINRPFADQIMDGYRKAESAGKAIYGRKDGIKRIWGKQG